MHNIKFTTIRLVTMAFLFILSGQSRAEGSLIKSAPIRFSNGSTALEVIIDRRIIQFSDADQSSSLAQRINALHSLLNLYFSEHAKEETYTFSFGEYAELNKRMASTASCSKQWDFRAGRISHGNTGNWLRDRLNEEHAFRELIPAFESVGYKIEISSMESINLCLPREIDLAHTPRTCETAIPSQAKLPCGALLTYSIKVISGKEHTTEIT